LIYQFNLSQFTAIFILLYFPHLHLFSVG